MIDVGTGSGILAITAAKLGAAYVAALDVDPDAVENARENIATNGVGDVVEAHVEDFTTAKRSPADVVTANLTGTLLVRHAADLARFVRPSGALIVSGFNVEEKDAVEAAFAPDLAISESAEEDRLVGVRPHSSVRILVLNSPRINADNTDRETQVTETRAASAIDARARQQGRAPAFGRR